MPYGKMKNAEVVESICMRNDRLLKPGKCPDNVYRIMISCWSTVSIAPRGMLFLFFILGYLKQIRNFRCCTQWCWNVYVACH
jgi:Protein tyrosine and serine/threonine kinase